MELPKAIVPIGLAIATISILLALTIENKVYAWHEQLGISGERAAELLSSNPNDPAITEWKLQLQAHKDDTILMCYNSDLGPIPVGPDGKITKEQREADAYLRESGKQSCLYMMDILIKQCTSHFAMQPIACADTRIEDELVKRCATHAITDSIVCQDPRLKEKVKEKINRDERALQYEKEQKLVEYCATHTINQSKSCEDPKLKNKISDYQKILEYEKERIEAQKGTILEKLNEQPYAREPYITIDRDKDDKKKDNDELKQKVINDQKVTQQEEEGQSYIEFCAKRVFYSNHLPSFCEDKPELKEKIEIEVQKLQEQNSN